MSGNKTTSCARSPAMISVRGDEFLGIFGVPLTGGRESFDGGLSRNVIYLISSKLVNDSYLFTYTTTSLIMAVLASVPPRIAILEADIPMPELEAQFGRYGDMFTRLLNAGANESSLPEPTITTWDIINNPESYPDPNGFDAVLITGSRKRLLVLP